MENENKLKVYSLELLTGNSSLMGVYKNLDDLQYDLEDYLDTNYYIERIEYNKDDRISGMIKDIYDVRDNSTQMDVYSARSLLTRIEISEWEL